MLVHPQPHRSPADYMSAGKGALSRPRLLSQHVERALAALSATSRRTSADPALTRTPQYALLGSAALVSHAEGEHTRLHVSSVSAVPLLTKIKWQVAEMSSIIAHHLNANNPQGNPVTPEEVVSVQLTGLGLLNHNEEKWADPLQYGLVSETYTLMDTESTVVLFSVVVSFLGNVIWNSSGGGRYPLELEAYSQALYALLDEYSFLLPSAPSGQWPSGTVNYYHTLKGQSSGFFATGALLEEALKAHHGFDVVKLHKGKWNCYALLGTLTLQLMGAPYQTHYLFNKDQAKWFCTLTVADAASGSRQILMQRMSKKKGDAWRSACIAALKENFPQAYADALRKYPDVDLTADHSAQGSKYRALPREKRIQHIASLFHMVYAFGKDDLGWQQMRVRLRNTSGDLGLPQWVAELEVQMEGEEEFRVVAASPACAQSKLARRLVIYQVAEQYFPKELATYAKLGRADGENPSHDPSLKNTTVYKRGGIPFVQQVVQLIEAKNPSYAPVSWRLRLVHCAAGGSTADSGFTSYQDLFDGDVALDELLLSPSLLVLPLSLTWEAEVLGNNGELSIATHRATYTPAAEGSSATPQTEGAVAALMTALRSASIHLCGGRRRCCGPSTRPTASPPAPPDGSSCSTSSTPSGGRPPTPQTASAPSSTSNPSNWGISGLRWCCCPTWA
ncbi:hypothetical protein AGDE_13107 [Angomonas deanei]|nr:hypothetical protein AGDE_13107 [Angomonas deanei]|eukprot:EPY22716.1 hypothetical protein AGDE_13107 [Angomonas deanei]